MDAKKILELIYEHEELSAKATRVLNYYYEEKAILDRTSGLTFARGMMNEAIGRLEDTINDCYERLNDLHTEYDNLTIVKSVLNTAYGNTSTSEVRKYIAKSLKEREDNE